MNCPSCNTPLRPGASFCPGCGTPVRREERCPECNAPLVPGDAFCSNCGAAILSSGEPSSTPSQYRAPSKQNSESVPSGYVGLSLSSNMVSSGKEESQNYSVTVKCEVTEENRNIIKQVFLRSFMNNSDSIEDNGGIIVIKRKSEGMKGIFRIIINPLPGARGFSVQTQMHHCDTSGGPIAGCIISMLLGLAIGGIGLLTGDPIGLAISVFHFLLGVAFILLPSISVPGKWGKQLNEALNQVVSFFN